MRLSVLIVDDVPEVRQQVGIVLTKHGYDVTEAEDGIHALEILASSTFDLIIVDIEMPRLDGLSLIREIRGGSRAPQVPILVLSGGADEVLEGAMKEGASACLGKPFRGADLIEVVSRNVTKSRG